MARPALTWGAAQPAFETDDPAMGPIGDIARLFADNGLLVGIGGGDVVFVGQKRRHDLGLPAQIKGKNARSQHRRVT